MKSVYLLLFSIFLFSCGDSSREYQYIELSSKKDDYGKIILKKTEPKTITALTDSAAYLRAYNLYCIALLTHEQMQDKIDEYLGKGVINPPYDFELINENGVDIAHSTFFRNKDSLKQVVKEQVRALDFRNAE
ncbi:MAG: hypothetical protein ACPGJS_00795 [Flammeovirgaceae bacterium]